MTDHEMCEAMNGIIERFHDDDLEGATDRLYALNQRAPAVALAILALVMDDLDSDDRGQLAAWLCEIIRTPEPKT